MSTQETKDLKETLDEHREILQAISQNQTNLMHLLQGNPINPKDTGLLGRIEVSEKKINTLETQRDRAFWGFAGVSAAAGFLYWIISLFKS
jgi:hypothetical protein